MKTNLGTNVAKNLAKSALFTTLMVVCAYVKIPLPVVPITFQLAVSILSGVFLGAGWGAFSMLAYCALGLVGLPVFALGGGFAYLFSPTFGYVIGFVASSAFCGLFRKKCTKFGGYLALSLIALALNYVIGIAYFTIIWLSVYGDGYLNALALYNLIYIIKDVAVCLLTALVAVKCARLIK